MKSKTVVVSAVLHVVVFGLALQVSKSKAARRATSVAVVGERKKPEKKKEEDKPKPKPKPQVASARPEVSHTPAPSPTKAAPEPTNAPAPVETGLTMGNDDGPGIAIGGPASNKGASQQKQGNGAQKGPTGPTAKKEKVLAPKGDNPEEDTCTEAPSKPVPLQKPNEVGYTQEARANGVEGILKLRLVIGADGSVIEVSVLKSVDAALDAAAIAAIKTWVFKPSMRCGKAMAGGVFTFQSTFELGD